MPTTHAHYVNTPHTLPEVIEAVRGAPQVGFDTEFISEGAYEPLLCLLQIATPGDIWLVDPLSVRDLAPLWQALTEPDREMIAVAAREEIRFSLRFAARPPGRVWDAQVAAGFVGEGYPLSHTNLVRKVLGIRVSGGESFTDWRQRPLSDAQLEYAADDVRYLLPIREKVGVMARKLGREEWIDDECRRLVDRVISGEQEERWWRVSGSSGLNRRELAVLRELWRWRDGEAREANVPPRKVLRDDLLVEIAKRQPKGVADLHALRSLDRGRSRSATASILAAVERAMALPQSDLPARLRRDDPSKVAVLTQLLTVATNGLAAEHQVDVALLATNADLQELVRWRLGLAEEDEEPLLLGGWRGTLLREPLLGMLDGKRAVRVTDLDSPNPLAFEKWGAAE